MKTVHLLHLGRTKYSVAWDFQQRAYSQRVEGAVDDLFLLTEHEHVYTLGKSSNADHLLATESELIGNGVDVHYIDRGGDITYHGPGQLVGYPILDLHNYYLDIHRYLRDLEEVIMRTLAEYGISSRRDPAYTGVWVGSDKIAAIGIKVSRWVTMHGFALNVNTDLSYFDKIIPCGIFHKGVTSVERQLGKKISLRELSEVLKDHFGQVFGVTVVEAEELFSTSPQESVTS